MMPPDLIQALLGDFNPKFLATVAPDGTPNVVPVISIAPENDDRLVFSELMIWKTRKNLLSEPRVSVAVISADLRHWTLRGRFEGFEQSGPRFERLSMNDLVRYNAYTGPRSAGVIRVEEVTPHGKLVSAAALARYAAARLCAASSRREGVMPTQVAEKFRRLKAAKCVARVDAEGRPVADARFLMLPLDHAHLLIGGPPLETAARGPVSLAAAVITSDPIAFQVKGRLARRAGCPVPGANVMEVTEVYSASPPLPGKRIV